jgi:Uma2 family endonuclease
MSAIPSLSANAAHESAPLSTLARRSSLSIPAFALSQEGFNRWATSGDFPDRCQISWIRGEVLIDMSPEEIQSHNQLKVEITRAIATLTRQKRLGRIFADRALLVNEAAEVSTEPDAMFASHDALRSGRLRYVPSADDQSRFMSVTGTPDWVLELVSKTSVVKDTQLLKAAYEAAGIPEYWLIDARRDEMQIQIFSRGSSGYESVPVEQGQWNSPLFGVRFHLHRERDEFGYWEYSLDYAEPT